MKILGHIATACALFFAVPSFAAMSEAKGYVSAENVITLDETVINAQRNLQRKKFEALSTVTKPTYYIVAPTETAYQTAETIITMVEKKDGKPVEYADVRVAIIYNSETDTYSAGEVSVEYSRTRSRM